MNRAIILFTFSCVYIFTASCVSQMKTESYCGYVMSLAELAEIRERVKKDSDSYHADTLWHLYDQINDSVRAAVSDTIEFEVFMTLLTKTEIGIDIYFPRSDDFAQKVCCAVMNAHYKGKMPEQRYAMLWAYTNPDGSGYMPFVIAIKRK